MLQGLPVVSSELFRPVGRASEDYETADAIPEEAREAKEVAVLVEIVATVPEVIAQINQPDRADFRKSGTMPCKQNSAQDSVVPTGEVLGSAEIDVDAPDGRVTKRDEVKHPEVPTYFATDQMMMSRSQPQKSRWL